MLFATLCNKFDSIENFSKQYTDLQLTKYWKAVNQLTY